MTARDKEIEEVSKFVFKSNMGARTAFIRGCEYADQHPREGLADIKKICGILNETINSDTIIQYLIFDDENIEFDSESFFEDFRKAMEDQTTDKEPIK